MHAAASRGGGEVRRRGWAGEGARLMILKGTRGDQCTQLRAQRLPCSAAMFGGPQGLPHVPGQTDSVSTHVRSGRKRPRVWQGLPSQGLPNFTPGDFGSKWGSLVVVAATQRSAWGGSPRASAGITAESPNLGVTAESLNLGHPGLQDYHSSQEGGATGSSPSVLSQLPYVGGDSMAASSASSAVGSGDSVAVSSAGGSVAARKAAHGDLIPVCKDWENVARVVEQRVRDWVGQRLPAWADALKNQLGPRLVVQRITVATDCEGMGSPMEALRMLLLSEIIGSVSHRMSCEIDPSARQWFLTNHVWPDVIFADMLQRVWPQGVAYDLVSESDQRLPRNLDLYICGFPCCPFSIRKGHSKCFGEEKAKPFFAVVEYIANIRPKAFILENVQGLEARMVRANEVELEPQEEITCLEYVLRTLRKHCGGYFLCIIPPKLSCPTQINYPIRRPREYILGGSCSEYLFESETKFAEEILHRFRELSLESAARSGVESPFSLQNLPAALATDSPSAAGSDDDCVCSWNRICPLHACKCSECRKRGKQTLDCSWRQRHKAGWRKLGRKWSGYSYFKEILSSVGINASACVVAPRERDLSNLTVAEHGGLARCSLGVLDIGQSYGWHQWRNDGVLPTLATGSALFLVAQGRLMKPSELLDVMGFPRGLHDLDHSWGDIVKLIGNTMHVAVVGLAIGALVGSQRV